MNADKSPKRFPFPLASILPMALSFTSEAKPGFSSSGGGGGATLPRYLRLDINWMFSTAISSTTNFKRSKASQFTS